MRKIALFATAAAILGTAHHGPGRSLGRPCTSAQQNSG